MKIGILTQALNNNYGGILQNYALQTVLKKMGHEVVTLDWDFANTRNEAKCINYIITNIKIFIKNTFFSRRENYLWTQKEIADKISKPNKDFIDRNIKRINKLWGYKQFRKFVIKSNVDCLIVGSDQVWRPLYNGNGQLYRMFLDFSEGLNLKGISYAASFGVDNWEYTPIQTNKCRLFLSHFTSVSVREKSGIELCAQFLRRLDSVQVLDPTLLLMKEDYMNLLIREAPKKHKGKLLTYVLDTSESIESLINKVSEAFNIEMFSVLPKSCSTYHVDPKHLDEYLTPSVAEWLNSFSEAEYVICDSFHGTVFSIIFNKPFVVIGNKTRGLARFESILKPLGLTDRLLDDSTGDATKILKKTIEWDEVNAKLKEARKHSFEFLENSLI